LFDEISKMMTVKESTNINKERIFQDIHKLHISEKFILLWQGYLESVALEVDLLF